jgi:predicted NAD-dependent protein-ADP-ribosyltransferase YbiA (DUF1768 family)
MLVAATGTGGTAITAAGEIICPAAAKLYVLQNSTAFVVTLKTSAGTGVAVAAGNTAFLFCDATNVNSCVTTIVNGNVTGNLSVGGNLTVDGNTTLGNATSDTITATGRFNTDLVPSTDNARDLGSAANSWKDLYVEGSAFIGTIDLTNLEVTNIKAKDGTASISLADSTGIATFSNATVISTTDNTNAALRITQLGTGDALVVEDSTNPDSTAFTIANNGFVGIRGAPVDTFVALTVNSTGTSSPDASNVGGIKSRNVVGNLNSSWLIFEKARGTEATPTVSSIGDYAGGLSFSSYAGTFGVDGVYQNNAWISAQAEAAQTVGSSTGRLIFSTTAAGSTTPTERMRISATGQFTFTTADMAAANPSATSFNTTAKAANTGNTVGVISTYNTDATYTGAGSVFGFYANEGTFTVAPTNQAGFYYAATNTGATNNYGFYSVMDAGTSRTISNVALTSNVVTITTSVSHGYTAGQLVTVAATTNTSVNGTFTIASVPAVNTFTYAQTAANITSVADTGSTLVVGRFNFYASGTAPNFFGGNTVISVTDNTNAALRITQLGTGNALLIEDSANPDSTPVVVDNNGNILQGTTTFIFDGGASIPRIQSISAGANNSRIRSIQHYGNSFGPQINFANAASTTVGDFTSVVTSGTTLGSTWFYGSDGVTLIQGAFIGAQVDGTAGANDMPGRLVFSTTADGASTVTERTRIDSAGRLRQFGTTIISNVDVLNATYDSVSFSVAAEEINPAGLFFSADGSKMFVTGTTGDDVNEYVLSTPWVVSSATYSTVFSVSGQDGTPNGIFFRADGLKMYVVGATNDTIFQYALTSPWSVATASYESISFSVAAQETAPAGIFFKPDGLSMYITGNASDGVYQYTLSTAWNVSTATFLQTFSVSGQEVTPQDLSFTNDGTRMFVIGTTGDDVNVYNLTTPWDISTATFVNSFSVAAQDTSPVALYIKPDGTKMYVVGLTNDTVYQYTVPSVEIQLTGTTAINGSATVAQDLTVNGDFSTSGSIAFTSGVIEANSTSAALRITQVGTGDALLVEDSANPDSTPFVINASGINIQGYTSSITGAGGIVALSQVVSTTSAGGRQGFVYSSTTTAASNIDMAKSASPTIGTHAIVASGETLGTVRFSGSDGTNFFRAAEIGGFVDGTPGTNDMPGRLVFSTTADGASSPTERMRIDSSGNVGIGTSAPVTKLNLIDALAGGQLLVATNQTNATEKYGTFGTQHYTNAEEPALGMAAQSNATDNIILVGGALSEFNAATQVRFYTAANNTTVTGTERARFNSTGALVFAGGTTTADGIGITFPATQSASSNANTLDDYEEGTFTPVLNFAGGTTGITYTTQAGRYTKIGRIVSVSIYILLSSKGSSTGAAGISGLPFTAAPTGGGQNQSGCIGYYGNFAVLTGVPMIRADSGTTTLAFAQSGAASAGGVTDTNFTNSSVFTINITYDI